MAPCSIYPVTKVPRGLSDLLQLVHVIWLLVVSGEPECQRLDTKWAIISHNSTKTSAIPSNVLRLVLIVLIVRQA